MLMQKASTAESTETMKSSCFMQNEWSLQLWQFKEIVDGER